jgi:Niemann-Pick C1 protein
MSAVGQGFCVVAAIAVFIDYLLQLTWFMAALTLDARRVVAHRADFACCVSVRDDAVPHTPFWNFINEGEYVRKFLSKYYAPVLMQPLVKVRDVDVLPMP